MIINCKYCHRTHDTTEKNFKCPCHVPFFRANTEAELKAFDIKLKKNIDESVLDFMLKSAAEIMLPEHIEKAISFKE